MKRAYKKSKLDTFLHIMVLSAGFWLAMFFAAILFSQGAQPTPWNPSLSEGRP
jgi:hypothetical protein